MKPDAIRRNTLDCKHDGWVIDGDFTKRQVAEALVDLRFGRGTGYVETLHIDADVRDVLVAALRRP
jgi:hypothetical protein